MSLPEEGYLLRIFIGESDKHDGKPLYEWLVLKARTGPGGRDRVARHYGLWGAGAAYTPSRLKDCLKTRQSS